MVGRRRRRIAALLWLPAASARVYRQGEEPPNANNNLRARPRPVSPSNNANNSDTARPRPSSTTNVAPSSYNAASVAASKGLPLCAPGFRPGTYRAGDLVSNGGVNFRCREFPYTHWCSLDGYSPGHGYSSLAWESVEECREAQADQSSVAHEYANQYAGTQSVHQQDNGQGYHAFNDRWNHGAANAHSNNGYAGHHTTDVHWASGQNAHPAGHAAGRPYQVFGHQNEIGRGQNDQLADGRYSADHEGHAKCAEPWESQESYAVGVHGAGSDWNRWNHEQPTAFNAGYGAYDAHGHGAGHEAGAGAHGAGYGAGYGAGAGQHEGYRLGDGVHHGAHGANRDARRGYVAGNVVSTNGKNYRCKEFPASSWCNFDHYAPGGANGNLAWEFVEECQTHASTSTTVENEAYATEEYLPPVNHDVEPPVDACPPAWEWEYPYSAGERVTSTAAAIGAVYECKEFPYTGHCGDHRAEVGVGAMFGTMWRYVGECVDGAVVEAEGAEEGAAGSQYEGRPVTRHPTPRPTTRNPTNAPTTRNPTPEPTANPTTRRPTPPTPAVAYEATPDRPIEQPVDEPSGMQPGRPVPTPPHGNGCGRLPRYANGETYAAGYAVSHRGSKFVCSLKKWCGTARFEPEVGSHWMLVWDVEGPC